MNGYSLQLAYTPEAAREVTDQIKTGLESVYHLKRPGFRSDPTEGESEHAQEVHWADPVS